MSLKKIAIMSSLAMAMVSGFANAADSGEVHFFGAVTAQTCDVETVVDGSTTSLIQLGSVKTGESGTAKDFMIKLKDPSQCDITNTPAAFVNWSSTSLNKDGIANTSGTAKDAQITLTAVNAKTANTPVNSTANDIEFVSANVKTAGGFKFKAQLTGGQDKGSVESAAAFAVRYQ